MAIADKDLEAVLKSGAIAKLYHKLPCHALAVERTIKLVISVCGNANRDGMIRAVLKSIDTMPLFETKKHCHVTM